MNHLLIHSRGDGCEKYLSLWVFTAIRDTGTLRHCVELLLNVSLTAINIGGYICGNLKSVCSLKVKVVKTQFRDFGWEVDTPGTGWAEPTLSGNSPTSTYPSSDILPPKARKIRTIFVKKKKTVIYAIFNLIITCGCEWISKNASDVLGHRHWCASLTQTAQSGLSFAKQSLNHISSYLIICPFAS